MSRMQKKCLVASFGGHVVLLLAVVFGTAFLPRPSREPESSITVYPTEVVERALGGGGNPKLPRTQELLKGDDAPTPQPPAMPAPPAPSPPAPTPPAPRPTPPAPTPPVTKTPTPKAVPPRPEVATPRPTPRPASPAVEPLQLTRVTQSGTKPELRPVQSSAEAPDRRRREAEAQAQAARRQAALDNARRQEMARQLGQLSASLRDGFARGTVVEVGGPGGAASASYRQFVEATYRGALQSQTIRDLSDRDYTILVEVVIARSGAVVSSKLVQPSGNENMDKAVRTALNSVRRVGSGREFQSMPVPERKFVIEYKLIARNAIG